MYAVVKTGGKQYRVEEGQTLEVDRTGDGDIPNLDAHGGANGVGAEHGEQEHDASEQDSLE